MSATTLAESPALDEIMLAMDVVDTLRHRERVADLELDAEAREAALIARLGDIYRAQGIDVPERILADGVKALAEKRFAYEPPTKGFAVALARAYVARERWLKPVALIVGLAALGAALWSFGVEGPRAARAQAARIELSQTLPAALDASRDAALALARTEAARRRIEAAHLEGAAAVRDGDAAAARDAVEGLNAFAGDLAAELTVRVVSRPGEYSGVWRIPDGAPEARNYYLIVEAVDARGRARPLEIASEEDGRRARVPQWGLRVPKSEFDRIAADKADNQIIENAVVGAKPKGELAPRYDIAGAGGAIIEW